MNENENTAPPEPKPGEQQPDQPAPAEQQPGQPAPAETPPPPEPQRQPA